MEESICYGTGVAATCMDSWHNAIPRAIAIKIQLLGLRILGRGGKRLSRAGRRLKGKGVLLCKGGFSASWA